MKGILPVVDILKISDKEAPLLTGQTDPASAAAAFLKQGVSAVAVTLGDKGAYVCNASGGAYVAGFNSVTVDTTGAGNSFWNGMLYCLLESGKKLKDVPWRILKPLLGLAMPWQAFAWNIEAG